MERIKENEIIGESFGEKIGREKEKSSAELLKEVFPLIWEDVLNFAKEKGFDNPEDIKKRIKLATKYNLEAEYFFHDPEQLERELPTKKQIEITAKEMLYVNEFAKEFSKQSKKPVFCIFNARNGTIYFNGMDTLNAQLNSQFEKLTGKENKTIQELRDEFVRNLKSNKYWKENKKSALMDVAEEWMLENRLKYIVLSGKHFKIPSSSGHFGSYYFGHYDWLLPFNKIIIDKGSTMHEDFSEALEVLYEGLNWKGYIGNKLVPVKTLDLEVNVEDTMKNIMEKGYRHNFPLQCNMFLQQSGLDVEGEAEKYFFLRPMKEDELKQLTPLLNKGYPTAILWNPTGVYPWWDNWPELLGRFGKKFEFNAHRIVGGPSEKIIQSVQKVEYLSEKVKNALLFYEKDEHGKNWFDRNGVPQENYFEMDEKVNVKIDEKGYPIPSRRAIMANVAQDELSRIEAAMEELK